MFHRIIAAQKDRQLVAVKSILLLSDVGILQNGLTRLFGQNRVLRGNVRRACTCRIDIDLGFESYGAAFGIKRCADSSSAGLGHTEFDGVMGNGVSRLLVATQSPGLDMDQVFRICGGAWSGLNRPCVLFSRSICTSP